MERRQSFQGFGYAINANDVGAVAKFSTRISKVFQHHDALTAAIAIPVGIIASGGRQCGHIGGLVIETRFEFRSEEHTSELQSLMRISYAVFCLKHKKLK